MNYLRISLSAHSQIMNGQNGTSQSKLTFATLWHNKNDSAMKDESPTPATDTRPAIAVKLSGIVLTSNDETSFVVVDEGEQQKRYSLNDALESAPETFVRKINKFSVVFETRGRFEKVMLHPGLPTLVEQPEMDDQHVLADFIIATPIRDGEKVYGLRLNPRKGYSAFATTLLHPGDIALRLNNLSLTIPDEVSQALSLLLTQQSVQFTVRRNGVPHLINVSVKDLTGTNGQSDEGTQ